MSEVVWFGRHTIFLDEFPDNLSSIIEFIQIILKNIRPQILSLGKKKLQFLYQFLRVKELVVQNI